MNPKLKIGLGLGCGVVLLAVLLLFGGFAYFAKQMGREYEQVKEHEQQLVETFGPSDRLPDGHDGRITADRLEAFLAVREGSAEWRLQVETAFAELLADEGVYQGGGVRNFIRVFKASRDLAPVFSGFWTSRNRAMLEQQVGMAEYIYLYCLVYYAGLGHDPADGALEAGGFLAGMGATGPMPDGGDATDRQQEQAERRRWAHTQVNRLMLPLLQQAAREAAAGQDPASLIWAEILQQESRAMQDDPRRLPFADGLPPEQAELLAPWRGRLDAAYSVTVNPIELIFEDTWSEEM